MNERVYSKGIARLRSPERLAQLEAERVVDLVIGHDNIKSILDVGTGSAVFAEEFSKRKIRTCGIDISAEMIEAASDYLPDVEFKLAPAEKIPYKNEEFDIVFMGLVFHEVDNYKDVLNEAFRVSKKNVSILEWNYAEEEYGPPLEHRLKAEFIADISKECGFSGIEIIPLKYLRLYKLRK